MQARTKVGVTILTILGLPPSLAHGGVWGAVNELPCKDGASSSALGKTPKLGLHVMLDGQVNIELSTTNDIARS